MKYALAFNKLVPGAQWTCSGDGDIYENYSWLDERAQPSKKQCNAVMAAVLAEQEKREAQSNRHAAFTNESDPLFFGWQRGENTEQEWLDKVEEIRARYPYPS